MKIKSFIIVTCFLVLSLILNGCGSSQSVYKNKDKKFQISYDNDWNIQENVDDYVVDIVHGDGNTANLAIIVADAKESDLTLEEYRDFYAQRLPDGIISIQKVTLDNNKGYWLTVSPVDGVDNQEDNESNIKTDMIITMTDDYIYIFYYSANGDENYNNFTNKIDEMLTTFKILN